MSHRDVESALLWVVRLGFGLIVFLTPLLVTSSLFFPFITGKNFFFRIVVEIVFAAWLGLAFGSQEYRPRRNFLFWSVSLFISSLTLATLFGANPYHSFWSNFERMEGLVTFLHLYALFLVLSTTIKNKKEWFWYAAVSLSASIFVGFYGMCEHFFYSTSSFCNTQSGGERIYSTFGNFIYLGVYAMINMLLAVLFAYIIPDRSIRYFALGLFLFNGYIFYLAGSRGPAVGLFVGLFIALCLLPFFVKNIKIKRAIIGIILLMIATPFILRSLARAGALPDQGLLARIGSLLVERPENLANQPRIKIWKIGVKAFQERPILGWGPENFLIPYSKYYDAKLYGNEPWFDRVHNMSLQWLVDAGIIGFSLYLGVLISFAYALYFLVKKKSLDPITGLLLLTMVVAYIVQNLFVFDTITNYIFFFSILAFLQALLSGEDSSRQKSGMHKFSIQPLGLVLGGVILVFSLFFLNIRPILANRALLNGMRVAARPPTVQAAIDAFEKPISYNTFATTEARERFADYANQVGGAKVQDPKQLLPIIDAAISEVKKESEINPLVVKNYLFLGRLYTIRANITKQKQSEGEAFYKKGLQLSSTYTPAYLGLAEYYIAVGENEDAQKVADAAFKNVPNEPHLFNILISIYVLTDNYPRATELWREYVTSGIFPRLDPKNDDADIQTLVGRTLRNDHDLAGRLEFLKEVQKKTEHAHIYLALAQTSAQLNNRQAAKDYAMKAEELNPTLSSEIDKFLQSIGF